MSRSACYFGVGGPTYIDVLPNIYKFFVSALRIFLFSFLRTKCKFDYDFLGLFQCDTAIEERISCYHRLLDVCMQIEPLHKTRITPFVCILYYIRFDGKNDPNKLSIGQVCIYIGYFNTCSEKFNSCLESALGSNLIAFIWGC